MKAVNGNISVQKGRDYRITEFCKRVNKITENTENNETSQCDFYFWVGCGYKIDMGKAMHFRCIVQEVLLHV